MPTKRIVKYKCPFCDKRLSREDLVIHIEDEHMDVLPSSFSPFRYVFNYVNKKGPEYHGKCTECGGPTAWDENKGRYNRQCDKKSCHDSYVKKFEANMIRTKGIKRISSTANGQEKMLAARKISGKYKFKNGTVKTYTGSYEKSALEFMDKIMDINPDDIMSPGPVLEYIYDGVKHMYITDFYYQPYNLIIEVKDGGSRPNKRSMPEYRAKQIAKEKFIIENTNYNYIRLTDNDLSQLLSVFADLKMQMVEETGERVIHVNEFMNALNSGYIAGMKDTGSVYVINYMRKNSFVDNEEPNKGIAITNSPKLDSIFFRNKEGVLKHTNESFLYNIDFNLYATDIPISKISNNIKENLNQFVEEGFLYETVFGKELFQYDQIKVEEHAWEIPDLYSSLNILKELTELYLKEGFTESDFNSIDNNLLIENCKLSEICTISESYKVNDQLIKLLKKMQTDCVQYLKKYSNSAQFKNKYKKYMYMVDITPEEYGDPYSIQISDYQSGIDYESGDDNNDWYNELLDAGEKYLKNKYKKEISKYRIRIHTGDGDECNIYLEPVYSIAARENTFFNLNLENINFINDPETKEFIERYKLSREVK